MAELVFELGCEELPASQVRRASAQLADSIAAQLAEKGISAGAPTVYATPRRLIVGVPDIGLVQPDEAKTQRGPSVKAAYDESGAPTKALEGFLRGQGVTQDEVQNDGEYLWVTKTIQGRATSELLSEILPAAVASLTFDKTMRWGSGRMRFARPIRWILAVFDGKVVSFSIEGVPSGSLSRGHRFLSNGEFEASTLQELLDGLRSRSVEPDPAKREADIREGLEREAGGRAIVSDDLVDENTYLTEWPQATLGEFSSSFLTLPESVLVTAMAKHEKMFPVRGADGRITNQFLFIRNGGEKQRVAEGNAWVLDCRFNDAKFFYDEDAGKSMDQFLAATENMAFQAGLGSVRQRADRLAALTAFLVKWAGGSDEEAELGRKAGLYAKADLAAGLVSELSSLQGVVGGEYASREGFHPDACRAIGSQYDLSASAPFETSGQKLGALLCCADQIDRLAACLGSGLVPSGNSDPYGLRRAATILITAALDWPKPLGQWLEAFEFACEQVAAHGLPNNEAKAIEALQAIFTQRYESLLAEFRYDVRGAGAQGECVLNPRLVRTRCRALAALQQNTELVQTLTRPVNLVQSAQGKAVIGESCEAALDSEEARALFEALKTCRDTLVAALEAEDAEGAAGALAAAGPAMAAYLDKTMIMVPEEEVRAARLALLKEARDLIFLVGDVNQLVLD